MNFSSSVFHLQDDQVLSLLLLCVPFLYYLFFMKVQQNETLFCEFYYLSSLYKNVKLYLCHSFVIFYFFLFAQECRILYFYLSFLIYAFFFFGPGMSNFISTVPSWYMFYFSARKGPLLSLPFLPESCHFFSGPERSSFVFAVFDRLCLLGIAVA